MAIDTGVLKLKSCQGGFVYPMKLYYPHDIPVLCRYTHHHPRKRAIAVVSLLASPPYPDRCAPPGTEQEQGIRRRGTWGFFNVTRVLKKSLSFEHDGRVRMFQNWCIHVCS